MYTIILQMLYVVISLQEIKNEKKYVILKKAMKIKSKNRYKRTKYRIIWHYTEFL